MPQQNTRLKADHMRAYSALSSASRFNLPVGGRGGTTSTYSTSRSTFLQQVFVEPKRSVRPLCVTLAKRCRDAAADTPAYNYCSTLVRIPADVCSSSWFVMPTFRSVMFSTTHNYSIREHMNKKSAHERHATSLHVLLLLLNVPVNYNSPRPRIPRQGVSPDRAFPRKTPLMGRASGHGAVDRRRRRRCPRRRWQEPGPSRASRPGEDGAGAAACQPGGRVQQACCAIDRFFGSRDEERKRAGGGGGGGGRGERGEK